jgi:hypothetical protein
MPLSIGGEGKLFAGWLVLGHKLILG